jgi:hypothetical protein
VYRPAVAGRWLYWVGAAFAGLLAALCAFAGFPVVGIFLGFVTWMSARAAVAPEPRAEADNTLRRACDRLPFCDCSPRR